MTTITITTTKWWNNLDNNTKRQLCNKYYPTKTFGMLSNKQIKNIRNNEKTYR